MPAKKIAKGKKVVKQAEAAAVTEAKVEKARMPQTEEAAAALVKYMQGVEEKEDKMNLLAEAGPVFMVVQLMQSAGKGPSRKRRAVKIPHPMNTKENVEVCLITTAPQRKWKDKIKESPEGLENIKKVIDMNKLRKKFKSFEEKRQLATSFNQFVADEAVLNFLPAILGKTFFRKSKEPICINMKKFPTSLRAALASTSYSLRENAQVSIMVGKTDFTASEIAENCKTVMEDIIPQLTNGWRDVRSVALKGSDTPMLPIYAHNFLEAKENPLTASVAPKRHRLEVPEMDDEPLAKRAKRAKAETEKKVAEESDDELSELSRISGLDDESAEE
eukprot:TRINITY_DN1109_c0_g1_i1.p1 TRINITY_DN1109_c0_g1~~TRINITY_DN1109_c0_g1_i1.p1  ORF type:complete len:332 (+),score=109.55 TRINITY_DN1109_c0_g1_i1:51-1046(+)